MLMPHDDMKSRRQARDAAAAQALRRQRNITRHTLISLHYRVHAQDFYFPGRL